MISFARFFCKYLFFWLRRYRRQRTGVSKKYQKQLWNTATVCYRLQGEQCCFPATHGNNFTLVSVIMLLHRFNNGSQSAGVNMCLVILEMSRVIERCTCCNLWLIYVSFFMYSYKVSGFEVTNDSEIIDRGNDKSNRRDGNKEHLGQKKGNGFVQLFVLHWPTSPSVTFPQQTSWPWIHKMFVWNRVMIFSFKFKCV